MTTFSSIQGSERPNDGGELEDPAFLARLQAATVAEPRAVEELVREFQPNLTAYARSRRFPDPDGVVNETLSDGLQNLPTFRGRDRRAFRAYLYQILRRRIVDEYRRSARQPDTLADFPRDLEAKLIDESSSSFDEAFVAESAVDEILAQLTIEQREVLEMRVLTGLSIKETADLTGRSESAVKAMHRRALRSLRTFLLAAAVVILGILGVRFLLGLGGGVSLIDNSPANNGDQSFGFDPQPNVPVVEVELDDSSVGATPPPSSSTEGLDDAEGPDQPAGEAGQPRATADARFVVVGNAISIAEPADGRPAKTPDPTSGDVPAVGPEPLRPCSVRTDARPRPGEIAFITFNFSGPYEFLQETSIDVRGTENATALFPGTGGTRSVKNGRTFPIILDKSMFGEDESLSVTATLANGELRAPCSNSDKLLPPPCTVTAQESPKAGDSSEIALSVRGPWAQLRKRQVHPIAPGRASAFADGGTVALEAGGPYEFALSENMVGGKRPWVSIAILGPETEDRPRPAFGRANCTPS